jgi:putative FmdB family regulatory protein
MPTYGYRCSRGHHWEVVQRMTEAALSECPECGAPATRVFYPVGVVFKGQGFYKTDSRGSGGIPAGNVGDGAGDKDGKSADKDVKSGDKDGKSSGDATKTDTKAKTSTESGSKSDTKADAPATPPPAKTEEK